MKGFGMVYSTDHGRMCPACEEPVDGCICGKKKEGVEGDGVVRVRREIKGRKGKGVTVISGVPLDPGGLQKLVKQLKQKCATGGTVKEGIIEIQGDLRKMLVEELIKQGYTVKHSGG
ncbi:MAG: translation initiation factor Sui1 [Candidatus Brocadiaceae bacterium]|nr:translation initiation factor Sui1 [Candidatus Brocadiaceae bacterium]